MLFFFFNRYLSDEGIEACISSSEKVNTNDIILVALNVSYDCENFLLTNHAKNYISKDSSVGLCG